MGTEVSMLGEYIIKWRCPECDHIVVYEMGPQVCFGPIDSPEEKLPLEFEG